jgi:2-polyprenyl-3-methyl-5-hydroxy-6-metoxy-1,4-benzoquinol methylase
MNEYVEANKELWNAWTGIHEKSEFYNIERFRTDDKGLDPLVRAEVGEVAGKSLLHLQCHFGMDTLRWARLGAQVTGADFSDKAVALARSLSDELGIPASFVCSNIYDLPDALQGQFDIVYTSHGVLGWLPDIPAWARVVSHFVKPGGTFYIAEIHPFAQVFDDENQEGELKTRYPYFQNAAEPIKLESQGSYADPEADYRGVEYGWNHTIGDIVTSLVEAGLSIEFLHEFNYCSWKAFPWMEKNERGWWQFKEGINMVPLLFSIRANKK